jgi:hypothetical protein
MPSNSADARTLIRRLTYDLTGLPPSMDAVDQFVDRVKQDREAAISETVERLIDSPSFGETVAGRGPLRGHRQRVPPGHTDAALFSVRLYVSRLCR